MHEILASGPHPDDKHSSMSKQSVYADLLYWKITAPGASCSKADYINPNLTKGLIIHHVSVSCPSPIVLRV